LNRASYAGYDDAVPEFLFLRRDGLVFLRDMAHWLTSNNRMLVYCDPPYLMSTRSSQRRMYRYELSPEGHEELLRVLVHLPASVMVSGYPSEMYDHALSTWRVVRYRSMTRGGRMADECLWCNFPEPDDLHDYRYLGSGYRERERIKRKQKRWVKSLTAMPVLERQALEAAMDEVRAHKSQYTQ